LRFKFTALATVQGGVEMWEGEKMYCTGPWKLSTIPLFNPLKSLWELMYIKLAMDL
jgi:hypothetical protein